MPSSVITEIRTGGWIVRPEALNAVRRCIVAAGIASIIVIVGVVVRICLDITGGVVRLRISAIRKGTADDRARGKSADHCSRTAPAAAAPMTAVSISAVTAAPLDLIDVRGDRIPEREWIADRCGGHAAGARNA